MSVVVKDDRGQIKVLTKGADSIIKLYLSQESLKSDATTNAQSCVDKWSEEGLRTLFLAERILTASEYKEWNAKVQAALKLTKGREEEIEKVDGLIEKDLTLVGSTAIEDKLQDEVADTIRFMKRTGIKVWVLTGDKVGTAINIGLSAGLLETSMAQHKILAETFEGVQEEIKKTSQLLLENDSQTLENKKK